MKNLSLILNVVLLIAVGVLYWLYFSTPSGASAVPQTEKPVAATSQTAAPSINLPFAYVNSDSLLLNYQYYKNTIQTLDERRKKFESEIAGRARALENEAVAYQQKSSGMTLEQTQLTEQTLYRKQQELVQYRDRISQQLAREEQEKNEELFSNISRYLATYTQDKPYRIVFGYSKGGGILYAADSLEITGEVLKGLNEAYQVSTKKPVNK